MLAPPKCNLCNPLVAEGFRIAYATAVFNTRGQESKACRVHSPKASASFERRGASASADRLVPSLKLRQHAVSPRDNLRRHAISILGKKVTKEILGSSSLIQLDFRE